MSRFQSLVLRPGALLLIAACASEPTEPRPPLERNIPTRIWHFGRLAADWTETTGVIDSQTGGVVDAAEDYGVQSIPVNNNRVALGEVFSSADGVTYYVSTQGAPHDGGSNVVLEQLQSFRKNAADATLTLTVTAIELLTVDQNFASPSFCPMFCDSPLVASVNLEVTAYGEIAAIYSGRSGVELYRGQDKWHYQVTEESQQTPIFRLGDVLPSFTPDQLLTPVATVKQARPIPIPVDITQVDSGQEFTLRIVAKATTYNVAKRESYVTAYLRDPAGIGGTEISFTGLTPTNNPLPPRPLGTFGEAPACTTPNPGAGTIEFVATEYSTAEGAFTANPILVARTGGTSGKVSATFTTNGGSAAPGTDYEALVTTVAFGEGEVGPKVVRVLPIPNAEIQPDRTVGLSLSDPKGCATLGRSASTLTIVDDDTPFVPDSGFSIGGTVSGLSGTGLILRNTTTSEPLTVANGSFTFVQRLISGIDYRVIVATQPSNPTQLCSVSGESGTVADANVTTVVVTCETPAPVSGLDPTFSGDGKVNTAFNASSMTAVVVQTDGKIVVAGRAAPSGSRDFALLRYDTDGSLDGSFGVGGKVNTPFVPSRDDEATDLALQTDGKIVVVGNADDASFDPDFAVARYQSNGNLDSTFGTGGVLTTDFGGGSSGSSFAQRVVIQPDGKIVVAGHASLGSTPAGNDFAVARYLSSGNLDSTFGIGGKVMTQVLGTSDLAFAVALQPDGRIVVAGRADDEAAIVRYGSDGSVDSSFGTQGIVTANLSATTSTDAANAVVVQADGKIVIAGYTGGSTGSFNFALARFNPDGTPDNSFGTSGNGRVTTDLSGNDDFIEDLVLQGDGKLVAIGRRTATPLFDFAIVRYLVDGTLDGSFGTAGKIEVDFFGAGDVGQGIALQPDGKIVGVGQVTNGTSTDVGLVRVIP